MKFYKYIILQLIQSIVHTILCSNYSFSDSIPHTEMDAAKFYQKAKIRNNLVEIRLFNSYKKDMINLFCKAPKLNISK